MPSSTTIAVVGAGKIGFPLVSALAASNAAIVVLLSRNGLPADKPLPPGVIVEKVDYLADTAALEALFKTHQVDAVVSAVATEVVAKQTVLIDAAKAAGVKLFIPSEFGMVSDGQAANPKNKIAEYLESVGLPYARVWNGMLTEFLPFFVGFSEHGKIKIVGKGDTPMSFTSIVDITGFLAYVLTSVPLSDLSNRRILRLQGDRATLKSLAPLFNTTVEHADAITGPMGDLRTFMMRMVDTGVGSTGWDVSQQKEGEGERAAGSANDLWPGHQWKSIKDVCGL
ncbi:hypothetical protein FB45DRAFT_1053995, partial [Roridomyces roridus]